MTRRTLAGEFLNAPNAITLTRIAMIPVFLWFTFHESRVDSHRSGWSSGQSGSADPRQRVTGEHVDHTGAAEGGFQQD